MSAERDTTQATYKMIPSTTQVIPIARL